MMTSSNGNILRVTDHLCGEFTGHRWIPLSKASDAELWCFLWSEAWINGWVNNCEAGDLRHNRAHYDVIVMYTTRILQLPHENRKTTSNDHKDILIYPPVDYLFSCFRKLTSLALCEGNPLVTRGFPSLKTSSADIVSILWRYFDDLKRVLGQKREDKTKINARTNIHDFSSS